MKISGPSYSISESLLNITCYFLQRHSKTMNKQCTTILFKTRIFVAVFRELTSRTYLFKSGNPLAMNQLRKTSCCFALFLSASRNLVRENRHNIVVDVIVTRNALKADGDDGNLLSFISVFCCV